MKKLDFQKIFCFISFLFILSCCIFYGTRFIKLYLEEKKIETIEKNTLVKVIKDNNHNQNYFKTINKKEYFTGNTDKNYVEYSNILWRIIKVNEDNSITMISNSSLTSLAYGEYLDYQNSYVNKWLNYNDNDYSGILEQYLNSPEEYLQKTITCLDTIDELNNNECKNTDNSNYSSLLSTEDFVNIGSKDSFIINGEYFYLSNSNSNKEIWYVDNEGKITTNKGTDIIGIKPVITIKSNIEYIEGNGTKDNPYKFETSNGLFGSYVKLGNDIWRIYQIHQDDVRLVLNDYIKINDEILTYQYSNKTSYHDDTKSGSIAYYLNHTYLNSLPYKSIIKEVNWTNGYYGNNSNYDYEQALNSTINTKVALISIGDIRLNNELDNYFTLTGAKDKSSMVYSINKNQKLYTKSIQTKLNVVPTISLEKELLVKGNGTIDSPFEME